MGRSVEVSIESMAFRGYGVARVGGKVVFVPYSATGDRSSVEIVEERKTYDVGRIEKMIEPSPWRTSPPCPYFGRCGGCQWQHIDYSVHGELKRGILNDILKRLGGQKEIPSITVMPSPKPYGYRIRVQLKVEGRTLGYYQERSHRLIDIDHCPISHPLVNQAIRFLREELPFFSRMGELEINVSPEEGKGILILYPKPPDQPGEEMDDFLKGFLRLHPILKGIVLVKKGRSTLLGDPSLSFTISFRDGDQTRALRLRASWESFLQVNPEQNQALIRTVLDLGDPQKSERAFDLYAGIGNLTLPLAARLKEVIGIEENSGAIEDARFNAGRNRMMDCRFLRGEVEEILRGWAGTKPDLIVLDPPRTGCKEITDQIVRLKPGRIVYISCEPTTFARDLRLLSGRGYPLRKIALIDMFPQSYHMEVVGLLAQPQIPG